MVSTVVRVRRDGTPHVLPRTLPILFSWQSKTLFTGSNSCTRPIQIPLSSYEVKFLQLKSDEEIDLFSSSLLIRSLSEDRQVKRSVAYLCRIMVHERSVVLDREGEEPPCQI